VIARTERWTRRWNDDIAPTGIPGVWRRKDGGFRVRGRITDPRTGQRRAVNRIVLDAARAKDAAAVLVAELDKLRAEVPAETKRWRFAEWAALVFERKVRDRKIVSAAGRATWRSTLEIHLVPAFGAYYVDKFGRDDIERFKDTLLAKVQKNGEKYSPHTVNKIIAILRQITAEASDEFGIADPCRRVADVSLRGHRTYTRESPNALKPADVPRFLAEAEKRYPQHYAFVVLGFTTGLRPSSLRPLRRRGPNADVLWATGELLVRRSHTEGDEVMDETKTGRDQIIALDDRQLAILRAHCDQLDEANARRRKRNPLAAEALAGSDLLFPAPPTNHNRGGGFQSRSALKGMFADLSTILGLGYDVSPRCMRRTYQDLCRAANVADIVTRSISGHQTEEMQRHYSTVSSDEQRAGLAKVIDIATGRERTTAA